MFLPLLLTGCPGDSTENACVQLDTSSGHLFIRDYQYDRYRLFDVGKFGGVNYLGVADTIVRFNLYQSVGTLHPNELEAVAYPNSLDPASSPDSVYQKFRQLDFGYDYELFRDIRAGRNYIFFPERLPNVQTTTLAYHMVVKKADGSTLTVGDLTDVPFRLQLLKRPNTHPGDPLWEAEWKNVYDLRQRNIDYETLDLDIFRGELGDEGNPNNLNYQGDSEYYVQVLGLDKVNSTGAPPPDNKVDDNAATFDTARGLLFFPDPHPFASELLDEPVSTLYTTVNPNDLREMSKYYIRMLKRVFELGYTDIVDGSIRVSVNGEELGTGFSVDRTLGKLWLTNDSAYVVGANVEVCFDYWK
jgi:cell surface protein SprA